MMPLSKRKTGLLVFWWLLLLSLYACSGTGPALRTESEAPATNQPDSMLTSLPAPPAVVPVGIDTSFVVAADSSFGVVLNADSLQVLEVETQDLKFKAQVVDTLAAVARFVQLATTGDDRFALSAADSQAVGSLVLRGMADNDHGAALMLGLEQTVRGLDHMVQTGDSLGTALEWDSVDPSRKLQSRQVRVAVLGFSKQSTDLRDKLAELKGGLSMTAMTADSARAQQSVGRLVQDFSAELDQMINEMGRASRNISAGALSAQSLRGLRDNLRTRRASVLEFEARWQQFEKTGSLDLSNPAHPFNSRRMRSLLEQMETDLGYLASLATNRAAELDTAATFQDELESRRKAEAYVKQVQKTLVDLKKRNRNLSRAYGRLAANYWKDRLNQVASNRREREDLYSSLEQMVSRAGGHEKIREREDLLATYRRTSDRLLDLRRRQLEKVAGQDRLSESVTAALAADLFNRARVLGTAQDYETALAAYQDLARSQPGRHTWYYQLASLTWSRSREQWAQQDSTAEASRRQTARWLDKCEEVLLQRHQFDQDMDQTQALLQGKEAAPAPEADPNSPVARAAAFIPADGRWYYRQFVSRARDDLSRLGAAANDPEVRRWLLNIDILRKRLAFETGNGDEFLYRYSRQAMLSENLDPATVAGLLQHWSWDQGNLALRRRWSAVSQWPDSTESLALVKADSLSALAGEARTPGVRRQINWSVGAIDFLKAGQYDRGLGRMHQLLKEVASRPNRNPEAGAIDSTITAVYPVFLYNRGTFYEQAGRRQEAFYCFLGVADKYATDLKTVATARYSAASMLADGNKRGALKLVREAINEALRVVGDNPADFDLETLVAMYELRQGLAGELGLFQEAVTARDEALQLKGLLDQASLSPVPEVRP